MAGNWKIRSAQVGVTLVEMMVVLAIAGVLAGMAIPSYREMMIGNRVSSIASEFHGSLILARSEALKRRTWVGVCASSNADSATVTCDASASDVGWGSGWAIYVDANRNSTFDAGDTLIRVWGRSLTQASDGSMLANTGALQVMFGFTGQTTTAINFVISAPAGNSSQDRAVCLAIGGRARVGRAPNCP